MLPESCKGEFLCSSYAKGMCGYSIGKVDIVEKFSYASGERMNPRMMAEAITSVPSMGWLT